MMKTVISAVLCGLTAVAGADEQQDKFLARTGGWLARPRDGRVIRIVDRQTKVPREMIEGIAKRAGSLLTLPFEVVDGETGKCYAKDHNERVGLWLVVDEDPACPLKMLAAPDDRFVKVNVTELSSDGTSGEKLNVRVTKEIWRGLVYGLGGGNNKFPGCLMIPAPGLSELDAIRAQNPCPAPFNVMSDTAHKIGIKPTGRATYRQACEEGWAPEPTNDCQKVIWNEIHSKPTKPLQINFDKKLGK